MALVSLPPAALYIVATVRALRQTPYRLPKLVPIAVASFVAAGVVLGAGLTLLAQGETRCWLRTDYQNGQRVWQEIEPLSNGLGLALGPLPSGAVSQSGTCLSNAITPAEAGTALGLLIMAATVMGSTTFVVRRLSTP